VNKEGKSGLLSPAPTASAAGAALGVSLDTTQDTKSLRRPSGCWWPSPANDSYLVDSASSHMLVSKIKPCMSKYKQLYGETANGSLYKLSFI
jgi:hypothetical protein